MRTKLTLTAKPENGGDVETYEAIGITDGAACIALAQVMYEACSLTEYQDFWEALGEIVSGERLSAWWDMGEASYEIVATEIPEADETPTTEPTTE